MPHEAPAQSGAAAAAAAFEHFVQVSQPCTQDIGLVEHQALVGHSGCLYHDHAMLSAEEHRLLFASCSPAEPDDVTRMTGLQRDDDIRKMDLSLTHILLLF